MSDVPDTFEAYAADREDARFTEWLRARADPDWTAAVDGRFVHELGADRIDDDVFRRYLEQDYSCICTSLDT